MTYLEFMTAWVALLRRSCWPPLPPEDGGAGAAAADISLVAGLDMLPDLPDGSEGQAEWKCEKPAGTGRDKVGQSVDGGQRVDDADVDLLETMAGMIESEGWWWWCGVRVWCGARCAVRVAVVKLLLVEGWRRQKLEVGGRG